MSPTSLDAPVLRVAGLRRLALASAFVRPRRLLVLDESEQRLDASGFQWLAGRLNAEKAQGSPSSSPATTPRG